MNALTDTATAQPERPVTLDTILATYDLATAREEHAKAAAVAVEHAEAGNAEEAEEWYRLADRIGERENELVAEHQRAGAARRGRDLLAADEERREAERRAEEHRARQRESATAIVEVMPEVEAALGTLARLVPEVVSQARLVDDYAVRFVSRQFAATLNHVGAHLVGRGFTRPVHRQDPLAEGTPGLTEQTARVLNVRHGFDVEGAQ